MPFVVKFLDKAELALIMSVQPDPLDDEFCIFTHTMLYQEPPYSSITKIADGAKSIVT